MIALGIRLRQKLQKAILASGVAGARNALDCDEQTMMRAAVGVPLRDDVAKRLALAVEGLETEE